MTVAFHGPAFSETQKDSAAIDLLMDINFGPTSDLYKQLVEQEQKVDQLFAPRRRQRRSRLFTLRAREEARRRRRTCATRSSRTVAPRTRR